jgi:hypothetical protein
MTDDYGLKASGARFQTVSTMATISGTRLLNTRPAIHNPIE